MLKHIDEEVRTMGPLVDKIFVDVAELIQNELALLQAEIKRDIRNTYSVMILFGVSIVALFIGILLVCMSASHFLLSVMPFLRQWQTYGLLGLLCVVIALACFFLGGKKMRTIEGIPIRTMHTMAENLRSLQGVL